MFFYRGGEFGTSTEASNTLIGTVPNFGAPLAALGDLGGDGQRMLAVGAAGRGVVEVFGPDLMIGRQLPGGGSTGFGATVASVGDVNGDGLPDFAVGDPTAARVAVFHGPAAGEPPPVAATLAGPTGTGYASAVAGADIDGDGFYDVLVGAPREGARGALYVYPGAATGVRSTPAVVRGPDDAGPSFGAAITGAGDVNADGFDDVVVGAPDADQGAGRVFVFLGGRAGLDAGAPAVVRAPLGGGFGGAVARPARRARAR